MNRTWKYSIKDIITCLYQHIRCKFSLLGINNDQNHNHHHRIEFRGFSRALHISRTLATVISLFLRLLRNTYIKALSSSLRFIPEDNTISIKIWTTTKNWQAHQEHSETHQRRISPCRIQGYRKQKFYKQDTTLISSKQQE
jgi:hypothetical protein